jgi:predicted phosphodiesterase/predicted RNase H-like HicB family nuclease
VKSKIVFTEEDGTWSAHDPNVPGVYGLGPTRVAAVADLAEAKALLGEYDASQADDEDEDAEDIRLADASCAEVLAGGATFSHEDILKRYGVGEAPQAAKSLPVSVKVGIVSDIHGDIAALNAALGHLLGMGCATILCPGDLLDVEPFGEEVIQRIKAEKIVCIRGNHERWALERRRRRPDPRKSAPSLVELPDLVGSGTKLSLEALAWIAALPSSWSAELAGVRVAMWHARPGSDMEGIQADTTGPALRRRLLDDARADVVVVGHTHDAFELRAGKGRILNPGACCSKTYAFKQSGALLEPAGYRPATFGVLELPSKRFTVLCALDGREPGELEDIRLAESRMAAINAGLVKTIPLDEVMRKLGIGKSPKTRRRRRRDR